MMDAPFSRTDQSALNGQSNRKPVPAEAGFWILIFGDLAVFLVMFVAFMLSRHQNIASYELFMASAGQLNGTLGTLNTLVLLTSSYCVACALIQFRGGLSKSARLSLLSAIVCGFCFAAIKVIEYAEKFMQGIRVSTDPFFEFYFTFTGVHLLHVVIGTGLLCFLLFRLRNDDGRNAPSHSFFEGVACYWHMVDLLWLVLFALFYMLG